MSFFCQKNNNEKNWRIPVCLKGFFKQCPQENCLSFFQAGRILKSEFQNPPYQWKLEFSCKAEAVRLFPVFREDRRKRASCPTRKKLEICSDALFLCQKKIFFLTAGPPPLIEKKGRLGHFATQNRFSLILGFTGRSWYQSTGSLVRGAAGWSASNFVQRFPRYERKL